MHPDATTASDFLSVSGADFCQRLAAAPAQLPDVSELADNNIKILVLAALRVRHHINATSPSICRTSGGIHAVRFDIRQQGCVYIVWNPSGCSIDGSVIPSFPDLRLGPFEGRILTTDEPIGSSESLLSAYSGLVKSTATVLSADIRPDPYAGALVVIGGCTGDTHKVVMFHRAGGEEVSVTISPVPTIYPIADNLVLVLPDHLRRYMITPGGVTAGSYYIDTAGEISTWMNTEVNASAEISGRLDPAPLDVIVNNYPSPRVDDIALIVGTNTIRARFPGTTTPENSLFIPDAACWCGELAPWRIESA